MASSVPCAKCGTLVAAGGRFCVSCGYPVTHTTVTAGRFDVSFDPCEELQLKLRRATYGEYEVRAELGRGGMAIVFLAHDIRLNRKVAIKVMFPGLLYTERGWERFLAEARTAAKLDHPNVSYVHSVNDKDRFFYFVMKYVDGRPLDDILSRSGALPLPVAQSILVQVARGLAYAHGEGVVHRDIKPANIMIDKKGNAIVMDFGIARVEDSTRFTQTGAAIGTPAYMSPEQCRGESVTAASDQYSLGIVAYELFSGRPPFNGSSAELQVAHMHDDPVAIGQLRPDLPPALATAVMRMLEKDPSRRFPSLTPVIAIIGAGVDPHDAAVADQLVALVKSGPPRRQSMPQAALSALAGAEPPAETEPTEAETTVPTPSEFTPPDVAPSALTPPAVTTPAVTPPAATPSAPASSLSTPTGPAPAVTTAETELMTVSGVQRRAALGSKRSVRPLAVGGAIVIVAVTTSLLLRTSPSDAPKAARADSTLLAASADALVAALGDSIVVGHGPDAIVPAGSAPLKIVGTDAVGLLKLAFLDKRATSVGDTVRIRLDVFDDNGVRVTSPQLVWATSNPRVVSFAGPGRVVGVREGTATVTVSAGTTTGRLNVTVGPRKAVGTRRRP